MGSATKHTHNEAKNHANPSRSTGLKRPPRDLAEWIRLANLVGQGEQLPERFTDETLADGRFLLITPETWPNFVERIARLENASLREELLDHSTPPENWRDIMKNEIAVGKTGGFAPEYYRDALRVNQVIGHYRKIRTALFLRGLAQLAQPSAEQTLSEFESLVNTLHYADLSYLRRCALEGCGKIFYAGKSKQPACTPAHSSALRKKSKRERDKLNRQNKRAKTARKR